MNHFGELRASEYVCMCVYTAHHMVMIKHTQSCIIDVAFETTASLVRLLSYRFKAISIEVQYNANDTVETSVFIKATPRSMYANATFMLIQSMANMT